MCSSYWFMTICLFYNLVLYRFLVYFFFAWGCIFYKQVNWSRLPVLTPGQNQHCWFKHFRQGRSINCEWWSTIWRNRPLNHSGKLTALLLPNTYLNVFFLTCYGWCRRIFFLKELELLFFHAKVLKQSKMQLCQNCNMCTVVRQLKAPIIMKRIGV